MIEGGITNFLKTEYIIKKSLDVLKDTYKYEFCLVNMIEIERRLEEKDLNLLSVLSDKEMDHFYSLRIKKNRMPYVLC